MVIITVQKISNYHIRKFSFFCFLIFFFLNFWFSHNFAIKAASIFAHGSKNSFSHIELTVKISSKSIKSNSHFYFFYFWVIILGVISGVISGDIDSKKIFKKSKTS